MTNDQKVDLIIDALMDVEYVWAKRSSSTYWHIMAKLDGSNGDFPPCEQMKIKDTDDFNVINPGLFRWNDRLCQQCYMIIKNNPDRYGFKLTPDGSAIVK